MFRDTDEELERLQALLLAEAEEEQEQQPESEFLDEEAFEALLGDTDQGENPRVYQNYSNNYGRSLRNYATGYKAYNTDKTDTDLEAYSQEVLQPRKAASLWIWLVLILMAAVVGAIVWIFLSVGGVI